MQRKHKKEYLSNRALDLRKEHQLTFIVDALGREEAAGRRRREREGEEEEEEQGNHLHC